MSLNPEAEEAAIAKTLELRSAAPPVARVSRRALAVGAAMVAQAAAAALGWSLVERHAAAPQPDLAPAPPPEHVTSLPRDYTTRADPPVLGPPLPGDLGRPIVSASRKSVAASQAPLALDADRSGPPASLAEPGRQTMVDARSSGLFAPTTARSDEKAPPADDTAGPRAASAPDDRVTSAERLRAPASPYILQAGAIIPAALVTGLRSDIQGLAIAQVTQDVFDSLGGRHLLIPAGSRLIGAYDTSLANGQSRLSVAWTRLILPSGRSIVLDKLPAADVQGMAGLQDGVDRHGRQVLAAAGLSTMLAMGAEAGASGESDLVRAVRRGGAQAVSDLGQQIVGSSLSRAATLTIRPGAPLRVLLTKDLVLEPYEAQP
jgi:type IV secretion system protein VirB10